MRAFVIGLGSMGQRRVRDLRALGCDVSGWDLNMRQDGSPPHPAPNVADLAAFDAVVISTPPDAHDFYVKLAVMAGRPYFVEAGVSQVQVQTPMRLQAPSCTPRFVPAIRRIRERLAVGRDDADSDIGTPVAYTLHVGQNLLDWHPGADLSLYYAAQRATGACREMVPFELGWLTWVFGPVTKAKALRANTANLADIDDVYQVVVEHAGGGHSSVLGHLLIDVVSRPARRTIHVVGTAGTFSQDIVFTEAAYLAEMRAFVESVEGGKPWPYTLAEERANLDVLHSIERSS